MVTGVRLVVTVGWKLNSSRQPVISLLKCKYRYWKIIAQNKRHWLRDKSALFRLRNANDKLLGLITGHLDVIRGKINRLLFAGKSTPMKIAYDLHLSLFSPTQSSLFDSFLNRVIKAADNSWRLPKPKRSTCWANVYLRELSPHRSQSGVAPWGRPCRSGTVGREPVKGCLSATVTVGHCDERMN